MQGERVTLRESGHLLLTPKAVESKRMHHADPDHQPAKHASEGETVIRDRVIGFDFLRFVSVLLVVWFHTGAPGSQYTVWRIPSLIIISAVIACQSRKQFCAGSVHQEANEPNHIAVVILVSRVCHT